jgi:hypothetical protein
VDEPSGVIHHKPYQRIETGLWRVAGSERYSPFTRDYLMVF